MNGRLKIVPFIDAGVRVLVKSGILSVQAEIELSLRYRVDIGVQIQRRKSNLNLRCYGFYTSEGTKPS